MTLLCYKPHLRRSLNLKLKTRSAMRPGQATLSSLILNNTKDGECTTFLEQLILLLDCTHGKNIYKFLLGASLNNHSVTFWLLSVVLLSVTLQSLIPYSWSTPHRYWQAAGWSPQSLIFSRTQKHRFLSLCSLPWPSWLLSCWACSTLCLCYKRAPKLGDLDVFYIFTWNNRQTKLLLSLSRSTLSRFTWPNFRCPRYKCLVTKLSFTYLSLLPPLWWFIWTVSQYLQIKWID